MARKARLFVPNAIYHVYCRTARGERVFAVTAEADAFIETLRAVRDTDQLTILAWCLMGNHYGPCRISVVRTQRLSGDLHLDSLMSGLHSAVMDERSEAPARTISPQYGRWRKLDGSATACVSFRCLGIARERQRTDTAFLAYVSTATDAIVHLNNAMK